MILKKRESDIGFDLITKNNDPNDKVDWEVVAKSDALSAAGGFIYIGLGLATGSLGWGIIGGVVAEAAISSAFGAFGIQLAYHLPL